MNSNVVIDLRTAYFLNSTDSHKKARELFKEHDMKLDTESTTEMEYSEMVTYFNQKLSTREYQEDEDTPIETVVVETDGGMVIPDCYGEEYEDKTDYCDSQNADLYSAYVAFKDYIKTKLLKKGIKENEVEDWILTYENEVSTVYIETISAADTENLKVYLSMIAEFMDRVCWFNRGAVIVLLNQEEYDKYHIAYLQSNWNVTLVNEGCYLAVYENNTDYYYEK